MADLNRITKEVVESILMLFPEEVYKILLYGSYAKGTFTAESDVDIMILLDCPSDKIRTHRKEISRLASRIGLMNDVEVSLLLRDRESFEQRKDVLPFYRNVANEGVALYG